MRYCDKHDCLEKRITRIEYVMYYVAGVVSISGVGKVIALMTGALN